MRVLAGILSLAVLAGWVAALPVRWESALTDFADAWAKVDNYRCSVVVHETLGSRSQDRRYDFWFKKPTFAKLDIVSGPGRGSEAVWHGGDKVRGHQGGLLGGIKVTLAIDDARAVSLRGDTIDTTSFGSILANLQSGKGTISEEPGPAIDGAPTDAIVMKIANPSANRNVSRDVVYLSRTTRLPVRRERFEGDALVKQENFVDLKLNPGLTESDF